MFRIDLNLRKPVIYSYLKENSKLILQFIFSAFFIGMGVWFFKHEQSEIQSVKDVLAASDVSWLWSGIAVTLIYLLMHGFMYKASFRAVGSHVDLSDVVILYLKRNLVSIFLPAGGVSSLAFFSGPIEKKGVGKSQISYASMIYGFVGILTVFLLAIPAFLYALFVSSLGSADLLGLLALVLLLGLLYYFYRSVKKKSRFYDFLIRHVPSLETVFEEISTNKINRKYIFYSIAFSLVIEILGILHLYIAMAALNLSPSVFVAVMGYVIAVIFMIISPFLRGMGAVELSMTYLLMRFGFSNVEAVSITFLYRFFEFWLPFFAGIFSFLLAVNKLLMRIIPGLLLFALGIVNIISVLTPAISGRLDYLRDFVPTDIITASNYFVFVTGLFLLVTAAFMFKGLKMAWYFGLVFAVISCIGHMTKAIDYEEALVAFFIVIILLVSRKQYYIKHNSRLRQVGLQTTVLTISATLIYGITGFYFLDKEHFGIDFSLTESVVNTLKYYFLIGGDLVPADVFARDFLYSINICGFLSFVFLIYTLVRPYVFRNTISDEDVEEAGKILEKYGNNSLDYFKLYSDKLIFWSENRDSFISYRVSGTFAIVLGNPVAATKEEMESCIRSFDDYCYQAGLRSLYYRVPEANLESYLQKGKRRLFLGQEAVVDLTAFTMEGGNRKSMRNSIKKVTEKGFTAHIYAPPLKGGVLQKIKQVSDEWLKDTHRSEIIFSQGMFDEEELRNQVVIAVESPDEKMVAFLNVIPDYVRGEGTYDLIRKTADAPSGVMDFLMVELFMYFKKEGYEAVNLGLAPMSGLNDPANFPEKSLKFAYEKIRAFSHYKGLRDFKEKFDPVWYNQYLIYEQDYDLIQIPNALAHVIKP